MKNRILRTGLINLKIYLTFALFLLVLISAKSQNVNFKLNETICYCTGNTPSTIIKLDNNWELVLLLRQSKSASQLDSLAVNYTFSQLTLLQQWDIIKQDKNKLYQTSIVIMDSTNSRHLRIYSAQHSKMLVDLIETDVLRMKTLLQTMGREKNVYSILFSYVIDGMVWEYLENDGIVNTKDVSLDKPYWDGEFWTLYPKRDFHCGTNSISDNGYSIKVNWSEQAIPQMIPFITRFDLQGKILSDFIEKGKLTDKEALNVFGKFNFFNKNGEFTVPIITENEQDETYNISNDISKIIVEFIKSNIDLNYLVKVYGFRDKSQALIIIYHEMIWDIMNALEEKEIINKPNIFKNPSKTNPNDVADIIVMIKNGTTTKSELH